MLIYIGNTGGKEWIKFMIENGLGRMVTAIDWKNPIPDLRWSLDNGAFTSYMKNTPFDGDRFLKYLLIVPEEQPPDFVICPDIVGDGSRSYLFSIYWMDYIEEQDVDLPFYLAVQNGMTPETISPKIERFKGLFVGGTMDWKHDTSESWVEYAHEIGLPCHIGRIGTLKNLLWSKKIGADSVDSSTFAQSANFERQKQKILTVFNQSFLGDDLDE